ncbi:MAG: alpha/beta hydrolase [Bdellovibrionales bacterium]|nr:alpha/beta hydrolase [Bdellovibrionales bacterium]
MLGCVESASCLDHRKFRGGGNIAVRLAANHPARVARVVLVSPGGFTPQSVFTRFFCRLQGSIFSVPPSWFARLYLHVRTRVTVDMLMRAKTHQAARGSLAINRALWRSFALAENDLREVAKSIRAPVLLIFGERDPVISAKLDGATAARSIPHAETFNPPCGHAPFAELPDVFLKRVIPFLTSESIRTISNHE